MEALQYLKRVDGRLSKVIDSIGEIETMTYSQSLDSYAFLVKEIVGQMISSKVKRIIWERFSNICAGKISPESICLLSEEELRNIGLSRAKSQYILNLTEKVLQGEIVFSTFDNMSDEDVIRALTKVKGIGVWTSKMYLIFFLKRKDVLPYEDVAFIQAFKWLYNSNEATSESIKNTCEKWKPYSSIGALYMYRALDSGLTKIPINVFLNK